MSVYIRDPELGLIPAIPEPFWYGGGLFNLFRWKPACYSCGKKTGWLWKTFKPMFFKNKKEWEMHYALNHIEPLPTDSVNT